MLNSLCADFNGGRPLLTLLLGQGTAVHQEVPILVVVLDIMPTRWPRYLDL